MRQSAELKKSLSVRDIWCLTMGEMIGFGCFVLPGNAFLPEAGPLGTALGLTIGAIMIMIISASYSYLIREMPKSGGSFLYAAAYFGKGHGFFLAWFMILTYWSLVPLNATALGLIGRYLFPGVLQKGYLYNIAGYDVYFGEIAVALGVLLGIAWINLKGAKSAGWIQTAVTLGLTGSVILVAAGVLFSKQDLNNLLPVFPEGVSGLRAVLVVVAMGPWAYIGVDCIPQAAEEFNFPPRKTLKIMLSTIGVAALMYIAVNTATAAVRPWNEILSEGWATGAAIKAVLGNAGLTLIGIAMLCAVLSGMNAFLLSASRLFYAMSNLDAIPGWFGKVDTRTGVPRNAIVLLSVLALAAPFLGRQVINWVVDMTSVGASLSFAYTCTAAWKVARGRNEKGWAFAAGCGVLLSLVFLGLLLIPGAPGFLSMPSLCAMAVWAVLGIIIFFVTRKHYYASDKLDEMLREK